MGHQHLQSRIFHLHILPFKLKTRSVFQLEILHDVQHFMVPSLISTEDSTLEITIFYQQIFQFAMGTFPPSNPPSGGANSTIQVPEPSAPPRSVIIAPPPTMAEAAEIVRRLSQPQLPMVPLLPSYGLHHRPLKTAVRSYLTCTDMMITRNQWTSPNGNSNTAPISARRTTKSRQN